MSAQKPFASLHIFQVGSDPVVAFAVGELARYLRRMSDQTAEIKIETQGAFDPLGQQGIWVGLSKDLFGEGDLVSEFDDAIRVEITNSQGRVAGANPRSVLLAVYRFLTAAGCRWVRPTADGEYIPRKDIFALNAHLVEKAAYRHRGICIEGAVSLQNVLDIIDWAPKVGFSGYFMQFREGHTFFQRWYDHLNNPYKTPEGCTVEQARLYTRQMEIELAKRGMIYHAIGHGWTCESFGIPGLGWDPVVQEWPAEVLDSLAEVNGKRAMWQDIPLNTSLCFSKPAVRQKVVRCVADYLREHQNIDVLHFWLDDGFNNKCECKDCRKMLPADFYVVLLNELDEVLTQEGYRGKVVFLAYHELLWPPQVERIRHPDRFILMFAPISRSYRQPLFPKDWQYPLPPFVLNRLTLSNNNDEQLAFLRGWQRVFQGDSFIFDYHLMQSGTATADPDHIFMARLLSQDIKNLKKLGLNGLVSCQVQRIFFPTGLPMYVMGRTLWDDQADFEMLMDEYFAASFGEDWLAAKSYLLALGELQDVVPVHVREAAVDPQWEGKLQKGLETIVQFTPVIERNLYLADPCQARSWFYLKVHADLMKLYLALMKARAKGDRNGVKQSWAAVKEFIQQREDEIQPVFDVYNYTDGFGGFERYFAVE